MKRYFAVLMLLVVFVLPAVAQDSLNVTMTGSLEGDWDKAKIADVVGSYAYVATGSSGLKIVDISDPTAPVEMGSIAYEPPNNVLDVAVQGDYAYLAVGPHGLRVIDVSDPEEPWEVGSLLPFSTTLGVDVQGDFVYVADRFGGVLVIDIFDPASPVQVGSYDTPGDALDVTVDGDYVYLAAFYEGLRIIDVVNPTAPTEVGFYNTPGNARHVAVAGDYAYVADGGEGLRIVDITVPSQPVEAGFLATTSWTYYVAAVGEFAFLADGNSGLRVIDATDPSSPVETGFYDTMGVSNGVTAVGNLAYVADDDFLGIYDCTDAFGEPSLLNLTINTDDPVVIPAGGSFEFDLFIDSDLPGWNLVDIWAETVLPNGNTFAPLWMFTLSMGPNTNISAENIVQPIPGFAPAGMYTFRIVAGSYPDDRMAWDESPFEVVNGATAASSEQSWTAFGWEAPFGVADENAGNLTTLPSEYSISAAYPNPFNPSTTISVALPETANLTVTAFNVNGQVVAELANGQFSAGSHSLSFDASNLASGLYFIQAHVPGHMNQVQKVMLVR
ncbi:LVIVD repeat protein [bacterium BMS3Bbin04]|nr:LVIVD repeat protein [bacterium BMS3Bbin04]